MAVTGTQQRVYGTLKKFIYSKYNLTYIKNFAVPNIEGTYRGLYGISKGSDDYIYVSEISYIAKFNMNGDFVSAFPLGSWTSYNKYFVIIGSTMYFTGFDTINVFSTDGTPLMSLPYGNISLNAHINQICTDGNYLYITRSINIYEYEPINRNVGYTYFEKYTITGERVFSNLIYDCLCYGITLNNDEKVYILDINTNTIFIYSIDGTYITKFSQPLNTSYPYIGGIACDTKNNIFIRALENFYIFSKDNTFVYANPFNSGSTAGNGMMCDIYNNYEYLYIVDDNLQVVHVFRINFS